MGNRLDTATAPPMNGPSVHFCFTLLFIKHSLLYLLQCGVSLVGQLSPEDKRAGHSNATSCSGYRMTDVLAVYHNFTLLFTGRN